jgi:hypothetical protein
MDRIVRRCGRLTLVEEEQGFAWTLTSAAGGSWYWHPEQRQWTGHACGCPTAEEATAGLEPDAVADGKSAPAPPRRPGLAAVRPGGGAPMSTRE